MKNWQPEKKVLLTALILYLPFLFLGYGSDMDTYNVLWAGNHFAQTLDYVPSRGPGFFVFETMEFFANQAGGSLLTNLTVMMMSLATLYGFMRLCREFQIPNAALLGLTLAVHPYYWVNSTCTMDYLFALGFVFLGITQVLRERYFTAGAAMALGIGSRATSVIVVAGFLTWFFITQPDRRKKMTLCGATAAVFAVVFYLPPADFAEWTTRFLVATIGSQEFWTPYLRIGRFVYKNIYFWSPLVALVLAWGFIKGIFGGRFFANTGSKGLPLLALAVILLYEVFYFGIPTEPSYLLPTIPFWLILMGSATRNRRLPLYLLLGGLIAANFVSVNIARPDRVNQATGAVYGLWVEPGHLVEDVQTRLAFMRCGYQPCGLPEKSEE